jgi:chemotaxis protein MotB
MLRLATITLLLGIATGCVGKAKYNDSLLEQEELRNRMDGMVTAMNEMGTEIEHKDRDNRVCRNALDETNRQLATKVAEAGALNQSVSEMQVALAELEMRRAQTEENLQSYRDLVTKFQEMIDAGTLTVQVIDGRLVVQLATDILFGAGSASLSRDGKGAISDVAKVLASIEDREYQIAGHTDDRPISTATFPSNWHLGSYRAISVAQLLVKEGLPADRVSAASYAEHRPADTNRTSEGRTNNRRIEIVIVPDMSTLPGYEELAKMAAGDMNANPTAAPADGTTRTRPPVIVPKK